MSSENEKTITLEDVVGDVANARKNHQISPGSFLTKLTDESINDLVLTCKPLEGKADSAFRLMTSADADSDNTKKKPNFAFYTPCLAVRYFDLQGIGTRNPDYSEPNTPFRKRVLTAMTYIEPKTLKKLQAMSPRDIKLEQKFFIQQFQKLLDNMYRQMFAYTHVQKKKRLRANALADAVNALNSNPTRLKELGIEMATTDMPIVQEIALFEHFLKYEKFQTCLKPDPDHEGEWIIITKTKSFRWTKDNQSPKEYPFELMKLMFKERMGKDLDDVEESERDNAFASFVKTYFETEPDTFYEFEPIRYTHNFNHQIRPGSFLDKVLHSGCIVRLKVNPTCHSSDTAFGSRLNLKNHVDVVMVPKFKPYQEEGDRMYQKEAITWETIQEQRNNLDSDDESDDMEEDVQANGFKRKRLEYAVDGDLNDEEPKPEEETQKTRGEDELGNDGGDENDNEFFAKRARKED